MKNKEMKDTLANRFPLNLQFFAEETSTGTEDSTQPENAETGNSGAKDSSAKDDVDYSAKFVEAEARNKKLKADLDNALKKLGELNKQYRAKMTEDELKAEQDAQAKEEHDAYVKELELFKRQTEAKNRYILQGMSSELAEKAAKAEIDGDMDELASIQQAYTKELIKAKEAEWKASRPQVNIGGDNGCSMTKEEIMAIKDDTERQRMIAANLHLFQKA